MTQCHVVPVLHPPHKFHLLLAKRPESDSARFLLTMAERLGIERQNHQAQTDTVFSAFRLLGLI